MLYPSPARSGRLRARRDIRGGVWRRRLQNLQSPGCLKKSKDAEGPRTRRNPGHPRARVGAHAAVVDDAEPQPGARAGASHPVVRDGSRRRAARGTRPARRRRRGAGPSSGRPSAFATHEETWRESVEIFLSENPELMAVLRADSNWEMAGTSEGKEILREVLPEARRRHTEVDSEFVAGPFTTSNGRDVFGIQVRASSELHRHAHGVRRPRSRGDHQPGASRIARPNSVSPCVVTDTSSTPAAVAGDESASNRAAQQVRAPSPSRTDRSGSSKSGPRSSSAVLSPERGPAIALASGLLLSALIAAALHFGTLAWRRERMLRRVNAALEEQIDDTRRGQGELRELSAMLEARVAESHRRTERNDRRTRDFQLLGLPRPARSARRRHQLRGDPPGGLRRPARRHRQGSSDRASSAPRRRRSR